MRPLILPLMVLLLAAPAAQARPSQVTIAESPRELRSDDAADRTAALDDMATLGADYVRINLFWRDVAPGPSSATAPAIDASDPNAYDWATYDRVVEEASSRGLKVMLTVTGPGPQWATRDKQDQVTNPVPAQFESFVQAAATHYGDVRLWSVWNEPNLAQFLKPQFVGGKPASPALYRSLYLAAKRGFAAAGQGGDTVLMGETAPFGTSRTVAPLDLVRGALKGKKIDVDGWAHHPYSTSQGPNYKSPNPDSVTIGTLGRLTKALNKAGYRRTPVWITEFGVQSKPDPVGVSQATQNRHRNVSERIAFYNNRVRSFAQYLIRDDLPRSGAGRFGGFESGLRTSGGAPKIAYDGFRLPLTADRAGNRIEFWGIVRPANGRTSAVLQVKANGWKTLKRVKTDGNGAFATSVRRRNGTFRMRWQDFTGAPTPAV